MGTIIDFKIDLSDDAGNKKAYAAMGVLIGALPVSTPEQASASAPAPVVVETPKVEVRDSAKWTENQMKTEMETDELAEECEALGIEVPEAGKNTNKKYRDLILDFYSGVKTHTAADVKKEAPAETKKEASPAKESISEKVSQYTMADVKTKVAEKREHLDKMRAKISELGSEMLADLPEDKWDEFVAYVDTL